MLSPKNAITDIKYTSPLIQGTITKAGRFPASTHLAKSPTQSSLQDGTFWLGNARHHSLYSHCHGSWAWQQREPGVLPAKELTRTPFTFPTFKPNPKKLRQQFYSQLKKILGCRVHRYLLRHRWALCVLKERDDKPLQGLQSSCQLCKRGTQAWVSVNKNNTSHKVRTINQTGHSVIRG